MQLIRTALAASLLALTPVVGLAGPAAAQQAVPPQIDFNLDSTATLQADGTLRVTGTVVCSTNSDIASASVGVTQSRRGLVTSGGAGQSFTCNGTVQQLAFNVAPSQGPAWSTGRAYANGGAFACVTDPMTNQFECSQDSAATLLRVRR
ncbi:hypothetical protein C3489_01315 [Streptomyces sp. Ru71]|uniref:hypothetical protein n=1 Tax=Streptomyces sp. Ru71 TaxID=2080746 RepID=UPI000CDCF337|nr:hypothetical protein [Streptomyces sp. Ru71]POX56928.1 hypothetical protein C3489_01315 [Streptomyces sp. Ru71]